MTVPAESPLALAESLLRRWRFVTGFTLVVGVATAVLSLILSPRYVAQVTFFAAGRQGMRLPSSLSGLAGQLGISGTALGQEPTQSPQFYGALVKSRVVLEPVLLARYGVGSDSGTVDSMTLLEAYQIKGRSRAARVESGLKRLAGSINVSIDALTGIVKLRVSAREPDLAASIGDRVMDAVNAFNAQVRQTQARDQQAFAERAAADADSTLRRAEDALRTFYERNHQWQSAPGLMFEEGRLRRRVDVAQDLYVSLVHQYQAAEVEAVNDVPSVSVVDAPVPAAMRAFPKRKLMVLVGIFLGLAFAVVAVALDEYRHSVALRDPERWAGIRQALAFVYRDISRVPLLLRPHR